MTAVHGWVDLVAVRARQQESLSTPAGIQAQITKAVDVLSIEHGRYVYQQAFIHVVVGLLVRLNAASPKAIEHVKTFSSAFTVTTRG